MIKINNFLKVSSILIILTLLTSCNGEFNLYRKNKKNTPSINYQKSNINNKLEIRISCDEENIEKYLEDGWKIKNKESKEKVCSWKSVPANNNCDIKKDKGCKIIKPDSFGTETIYLLEK